MDKEAERYSACEKKDISQRAAQTSPPKYTEVPTAPSRAAELRPTPRNSHTTSAEQKSGWNHSESTTTLAHRGHTDVHDAKPLSRRTVSKTKELKRRYGVYAERESARTFRQPSVSRRSRLSFQRVTDPSGQTGPAPYNQGLTGGGGEEAGTRRTHQPKCTAGRMYLP